MEESPFNEELPPHPLKLIPIKLDSLEPEYTILQSLMKKRRMTDFYDSTCTDGHSPMTNPQRYMSMPC